ncbi:MFS transporter [Paenibacillus taichungensis]|uniref:MFS transporter n=1 Tax=Paenibacillus taichungensis TaxID=484184 RepID=A0A329QE95_9BACL|nr:MFS transporter [Paenibacillus taichungensis]RAW09542.1 MFS transporter [Paenibacillus taichungensis]
MSSTFKIYILAVLSFLVGTSEYVIAGILDKIAMSTGVSLVTAGQLITVFSLAYAFGTPLVMVMTARMERKKLLLTAIGFFVLSNVLAYVLPGIGLLNLSRIMMGISAGVVVVVSMTIATKVARPGKEGSALAAVLMGFTASLIFGVPLGRIMATTYEWKAVFGVIALLGFAAIFLIALLIPRIQGEAAVSLRKQVALLKEPRVMIALSVTFFWIIGYSIFYSYITPFLLTSVGMHDSTLNTILFVIGIASLIGSRSGGYATDKWGLHRVLKTGLGLNAIALILIAFGAHAPVLLIVMLILWSIAVWSLGPPQQLHIINISPESTGIMLSLNSMVLQLAMAAGAGVGGLVVERISLSAITWFAAAAIVLAFGAVNLSQRKNN